MQATVAEADLVKVRPRGRRPLGDLAWMAAAAGIALLVALPVIFVFSYLFVPAGEIWSHLASTVLPQYVLNSLLLGAGVVLGVTVIGVGTAWLVTTCDFPGRPLFEWALLLPLAVPAYIIGYTYTDFLQYAGPVQSLLRDLFDWTRRDYWFPEIRSLPGAIAVMSLVFYPYVYLFARAAFIEQSACMLDISRTLGRNPWQTFTTVALPLARPAIAGGAALALMEALADFGTVQYFGVPTFTTGIYRTWFALGEPAAAAQLAAILMILVLSVLTLERWLRGDARFDHTSARRALHPFLLAGAHRYLAMTACALPIVLGFGIPVLILLEMSLSLGDPALGGIFFELASNSLILAGLAAALAVGLGLVIAYGLRIRPGATMRLSARIAALGYAVPGSVIAVGVLIPFARFDNALDAWMRESFGVSTGLLLSGSIAILLFAYLVRFLAVALNAVEAGLTKVNRSLDDASRVLGHSPGGTLVRVHVPMLWSSVTIAGIMVLVDVLKELPATLILRPFDFETLAVRVYRFASDERLAEASTSALAIVVVGLLPVLILSRTMARTARGR